MPRFDAASISIRSKAEPAVISPHDWHSLQGSAESRLRPEQLSAFASRRAAGVFPVPRLPLKRYACETRPPMMAPWSARDAASWPTRSPNVCDRYLRYRLWYSGINRRQAPLPQPSPLKVGGRSGSDLFKWSRTPASIEVPQLAPRFTAPARMAAAPSGSLLTAASFRT